MNSGDTHVYRVAFRDRRQCRCCNQRIRQFQRLCRYFQLGNPIENGKSLSRRIRVTSGGLDSHQLRGEYVEFRTFRVPPFARSALMGGAHQISTWPSHQVAYNCRFDVDRLSHDYLAT